MTATTEVGEYSGFAQHHYLRRSSDDCQMGYLKFWHLRLDEYGGVAGFPLGELEIPWEAGSVCARNGKANSRDADAIGRRAVRFAEAALKFVDGLGVDPTRRQRVTDVPARLAVSG
jgi:hypothetical protein